ncbi:MAG TPA: LuxR C-terminal-related transcriptional regulator [Gammaproteobacteria bacterium]
MKLNDAHWLTLTDAFYAAAVEGGDWQAALEGFAAATGSAVGELVCFGPNASVPINVVTGIDPAFNKAFVEAGGGDPAFNPRVRAGTAARPLQSRAEADFITPDEIRRDPHYQEFAIPWDIPFVCVTTLEKTGGLLVGLAVARTHRQGHITDTQRRVFDAISPHVRAAVRMQIALEGRGQALLNGALDALSIPAFVCDGDGRVQGLTPAAEQLLGADRGLALRQGQLQGVHPADAKALKDAISIALHAPRVAGGRPPQAVVMHDTTGAISLVLDVVALPVQSFQFCFAPRVLVVARGERGPDAQRAVLLQTIFALTAAEADIAIQVSRGHSPELIAARRNVSIGTVRSQIKAIMAKLGVSRQIELAAKVNRF